MTTTDLIKLLKENEFSKDGISKEITICKNGNAIIWGIHDFTVYYIGDGDDGERLVLEV